LDIILELEGSEATFNNDYIIWELKGSETSFNNDYII
jgi:hypothetical protein